MARRRDCILAGWGIKARVLHPLKLKRSAWCVHLLWNRHKGETQHVLTPWLPNSLMNFHYNLCRWRQTITEVAPLVIRNSVAVGWVLPSCGESFAACFGLCLATLMLLASPKRAGRFRAILGICRTFSLCCASVILVLLAGFLSWLTGVLEDGVCLLASLLPVAALVCSPDFRDAKNLKDHLVHLLGWRLIVPHSVFSSVLSRLIDPSGGAFVTRLGRHISKCNILPRWKMFPDMQPTILLVYYHCHFAITSVNYHVHF